MYVSQQDMQNKTTPHLFLLAQGLDPPLILPHYYLLAFIFKFAGLKSCVPLLVHKLVYLIVS